MVPASRYIHPVRKRRAFIVRSYKKSFLMKALMITLFLVCCYMLAPLQVQELTSSQHHAADGDDMPVCVKKILDQCTYFPCEERGGETKEILFHKPTFGYAGRFVRRVSTNITKPIPECESVHWSLVSSCHTQSRPIWHLQYSTRGYWLGIRLYPQWRIQVCLHSCT